MKVEGLSFFYPRRGEAVLEDISFEAVPGEMIAVLGNNGAGKSTLLKCLCRILRPRRGAVFAAGEENVLKMTPGDIAGKIAIVLQEPPVSRLRVYDMVMLGRNPHIKWAVSEQDRRIVESLIRRLELECLALRFLEELSGGERQKALLARALAQDPKILLLDEPTSNLDLKNQHETLSLVRRLCVEEAITAIMVIHDINLALKYCGRFLLMKEGRIFASGGRDIITAENIEAVYQIPVRVYDLGEDRIIVPGTMSGSEKGRRRHSNGCLE
ncbi:MAG: ABC transporter ATP-binding protein [Treponema sp.]|jgi:iron complex transport system ATP-binding protein|nr:ABC transporter ATP-binding protein [Treponema sp.]